MGHRATVRRTEVRTGLDDFVGRSYPGWNRHVALTALAYAFLQVERQRHGTARLTFPQARAVMTDILTAFYFVRISANSRCAETGGNPAQNLTKSDQTFAKNHRSRGLDRCRQSNS